MTRLIFVRHGESNTSVQRLIGGYRTCTGLSALGRAQVERLRDRWIESPEFTPDVLISSNFARARETAAILASALGNLPVEEIVGFGEHDPGEECDGLSYDEFVEKYGTVDYENDPFVATFPGGETVAAFHFRIGETMSDTLRRYPDKTIVVTCHGGVVDAAFRQALRLPITGVFDMWTINASVTELVLARPGRWRLVRYNDHAHLAGLEVESSRNA